MLSIASICYGVRYGQYSRNSSAADCAPLFSGMCIFRMVFAFIRTHAPPFLFHHPSIVMPEISSMQSPTLDSNLGITKNFSQPNAFTWILLHTLALSSFIAIDWFLNEKVYHRNSGIVLMPLMVGLIQMFFLRRQLRWPWLWPILTILGIPLSFLGIWWFMLCIGGGFGITQAIHLKLSGYKRVYIWIFLSFIGWVSGALYWSWLSQVFQPPYFWDMIGLYATVGMAYGSSTWLASGLMVNKNQA